MSTTQGAASASTSRSTSLPGEVPARSEASTRAKASAPPSCHARSPQSVCTSRLPYFTVSFGPRAVPSRIATLAVGSSISPARSRIAATPGSSATGTLRVAR
jgi:hypothetical protein